MGLQIIVGCDIEWPAARDVGTGSAHTTIVTSRMVGDRPVVGDVRGDISSIGLTVTDEMWEHPTSECHSPFWPWACWLGPERNDERYGAIVIDHHRDCRACVLAMGVAAVNAPWRDVPHVKYMRDWYEAHRLAHQLPPLPEGR